MYTYTCVYCSLYLKLHSVQLSTAVFLTFFICVFRYLYLLYTYIYTGSGNFLLVWM